MNTTTNSKKINSLIAHAERNDLVVTVEQEIKYNIECITVRISNAQHQWDAGMSIVASRYVGDGKARAYKMLGLRHYGGFDAKKIKPTKLRLFIDLLVW